MNPRRAALALVVALGLAGAGCGAGASPGATQPSPAGPTATPRPTDVPTAPPVAVDLPDGFTPATDEVVLRAWAIPDVAGDGALLPTTVLADGSILVPHVETFHGPGVRRLTAAGLAALRERARATGLFEASRTIPPLRTPESGFISYRVELRDGKGPVTVETINAFPSADGRALIDLADAILGIPDAALSIPAGDYVDGSAAPVPYRATTTRLTTEVAAAPPGAWQEPDVEVGRVSWPIADGIRAAGVPFAVPDAPGRALRCALVSGEEEARIRAALRVADAEPAWSTPLLAAWDLLDPAVPGILRVTLRPFLPGEDPACGADPLPGPPEIESEPPPGFAALWQAAAGGATVPETVLVRVEITRQGAGGGPVASRIYLADGSILDLLDPPPPAVAVGVRELGSAGLGRLRDLLASPALPRADLDEAPPGDVDATAYSVEGLFGSRWVTARVTDWRPSASAAAVIALARSLAAPETWAGDDGWAGGHAAVEPWLPLRVRLVVERYEGEDTTGLPPVATVRWPFEGALDEPRCEELGYTEADVIVRALNTVGAEQTGGWALQGDYDLAGGTPGTMTRVSLTVLLPGEELGCP